MLGLIIWALSISITLNALLFLIAYKLQSDKLTDISYAISFLALAIYALIKAGHSDYYSVVIFLMILIWSLRIGSFLLNRVLKVGKDKRFDGIRANFFSFGRFWLGQALTAWVLTLPALLAINSYIKFDNISIGGGLIWNLGVVVWAIGLIIESVADYQKFNFHERVKPKQAWIDEGIWKHSRHPNYFGEILVWVGIYISSFVVLSTPYKIIGLASPILIFLLLVYVSGIPPLEKSADKRWGKNKEYIDYKKQTNLLIPLSYK